MTRIVVHIDRLVLRGVNPADRHAVAASLQAELQRQFALPGVAQALTNRNDTHLLRAGVAHGSAQQEPGSIGRAVAGQVARSIQS